ncbi:GNAT family N-acetyltransferase [Pedobacter sp. L105]|uniref:GNAT family N-acetyltransferase n=1 Tax=Pedobacter sp. L105 TaxID=1641871 RepID=UPI00131C862F|nr:GNAT family N-acetyltransferase [Pedobacter sp. L105]
MSEVNKDLQFIKSTTEDIDAIFGFYDDAIAFQKTVFKTHWKGFERSLIEREVAEGRQWKIIKDGRIACIFAVEFSDPLIWKEKNGDPSIYLHRIVSHSSFRGNNFMLAIVKWAKDFAKANSLQFIRMDTWGDNPQLINYYVKSGFRHVGFTTPERSPDLPKHYEGIDLALFELTVD